MTISSFSQLAMFILLVLNIVVTLTAFLVIKFNDFKHVEKDLNEIKEEQKGQRKDINKLNTEVAIVQQEIKDLK